MGETMNRSLGAALVCLAAIACSQSAPPAAATLATEADSLRAWATGVEAAFERFEGCGGGDAARAFYAKEGAVITTDSATMVLAGDALTTIFQSTACTYRETTFKLDSLIVRPIVPGVGLVAATYLETMTDTANVRSRLRGAVTWIVQRTDSGWKATSASVTEHRTRLK
jgi:hypothetical protein